VPLGGLFARPAAVVEAVEGLGGDELRVLVSGGQAAGVGVGEEAAVGEAAAALGWALVAR
jgi:hypothetical protein